MFHTRKPSQKSMLGRRQEKTFLKIHNNLVIVLLQNKMKTPNRTYILKTELAGKATSSHVGNSSAFGLWN